MTVGCKVRIIKDIWDDGQDHHPAGYIARIGEIVTVHEVRPNSCVCSHEGAGYGRFVAMLDEIEAEGGAG